MLTMSERHQSPKGVENNAGATETVDVQFTQIFYRCEPTLIGVVNVLLKTAPYIFKDLVDDCDCESRVVALQVVSEHSQECNVAVLDLPRLRKDFVKSALDHGIVPIKFPYESEYLVDGLLCQNVVDDMANK